MNKSINKARTIGLFLIVISAALIIYFNWALLVTRVYPVYLSLSGSLLDSSLQGYEVFNHKNLTIYHDIETKDALNYVKQISEDYNGDVLGFFNVSEEFPIDIIIFSNEKDLKGVFRIPENYSAMGAYSGGKIGLLSPLQYGFYNQSDGMLANVYVHELTHMVLDKLANGNVPLWFTEGTALFMEYNVLGYEWGQALSKNEPNYTVEELTGSFSSLDEYAAYRQSFLIVKNLINEFGRDKFLAMVKMLGNGENFSNAVENVYGLKLSQLNNFR